MLNELNLPVTLQRCINQVHDAPINKDGAFVLYLPTVVLRSKHNPAFALACRLANHHHVPVIVMAVVLDDHHLPVTESEPIAFTARRVAFVLEALQQASTEWESHGAGVAIRVHGSSCRCPHHLTLAQRATAVVSDEPFVNPYLKYVESVERAVKGRIPCYRADGSTTVPPVCAIQKKVDAKDVATYTNIPQKAWIWEKTTSPKRKEQVRGVVKDGHFDAPDLDVKLEAGFFLDSSKLTKSLPSDWMLEETPCPGRRPWSAQELAAIQNLKDWVMTWPSVDTSVPPCHQTHGSATSGYQRWSRFCQEHLKHYAKKRNDITKPHSVSRMSCYLNYGVVSIFEIVHQLWQAKGPGKTKFHDEIIKWREIGYCHAFCFPRDYNREAALPQWSRHYLCSCQNQKVQSSFKLEQLANATTNDETWNAMQEYLVSTGELHNNARMTWGKTIVHWQKLDNDANVLLHHLCYLNDRFALDGLSPPSYAGLLWCLGWCDKPGVGGRISSKPASRYRCGPADFQKAKTALLAHESQESIVSMIRPTKKARVEQGSTHSPSNPSVVVTPNTDKKKARSGGIFDYLVPKSAS